VREPVRELKIVQRIRDLAESGHRDRRITRGIGDDSAVFRPHANEDLVFTSDFVLEGRHFTLQTHTPGDIGYLALARSLSDLAAMGAEPVFCIVSLAVPGGHASGWVGQFYRGLLRLADKYKMTLAGGDLARFDRVVSDVMCCGRVPRGEAILRSGAKPGDGIYVTGELGGSAHGFAIRRGKAWGRLLRPQPRIEAGVALRRLGVSAGMDISDGLSLDLHRLCIESRVSAELEFNLPIAAGASVEEALHGGEDYELLFTASPGTRVPGRIAGLSVSQIGVITRGRIGQVRFGGRVLKSKGFDHFS